MMAAAVSFTPETLIRPAEDRDRGFIFSNWATSFGDTPWARERFNTWGQFYAVFNVLLDRILPSCDLHVACLPEDSGALIGFVAAQRGVLRYVYVRRRFRGMGIAKQLAASVGCKEARWHFDLFNALEIAS